MNRSFLTRIGWLALAACGSTLLAMPAVRQCDAAAPAGIQIVNPESTGVTWSYLIDGQTQTLQAGYSQQIDSACTIAFDRGGGLGEAKYGLTDGTYTFTETDGHWDLFHTEDKPAGNATAGIGAVDEGTTTTADPVTPGEEKMFQEMYARASLNAATMKLVEEDWQGKTHAARKSDYDSFMAQVRAARGEAQGASSTSSQEGNSTGALAFHSNLDVTSPDGALRFIATNEGDVQALNSDGKLLWSTALHDNVSGMAQSGSRLFVLQRKSLSALDSHTGRLIWSNTVALKEGETGELAAQGKEILIKSQSGELHFDSAIGRIIRIARNTSDEAPQPVAAVQTPVVQSQVMSEEDKRMFWEMYRDAGLDKTTLKMVSDDWKNKTSAQRKAAYDSFMKQVEEMRQAANTPASKTDDLP